MKVYAHKVSGTDGLQVIDINSELGVFTLTAPSEYFIDVDSITMRFIGDSEGK